MTPIIDVENVLEKLYSDPSLARNVIWRWLKDQIAAWRDRLRAITTPTSESAMLAENIVHAAIITVAVFCQNTEEDQQRREIVKNALDNSLHLLLEHNWDLAPILMDINKAYKAFDRNEGKYLVNKMRNLPTLWEDYCIAQQTNQVIYSPELDTELASLYSVDLHLRWDLNQLLKWKDARSHMTGEMAHFTQLPPMDIIEHMEAGSAEQTALTASRDETPPAWSGGYPDQRAWDVVARFPGILLRKANDIEVTIREKPEEARAALFGHLYYMSYDPSIPEMEGTIDDTRMTIIAEE